MKSLTVLIFVALVRASLTSNGLKVLTPEEAQVLLEAGPTDKRGFSSSIAAGSSRYVPPDQGGNYGDLIYRYREDGDVLLLRELVVIDELSTAELEVQWYTSLKARRISSVRVLNIGRERAFCRRIDVAGADAQVLIGVAPRRDPRILIEIYGF